MNIFFSNKGITATSATTIANYAQEVKRAIMQKLNNISFIKEERDLVGTDSVGKVVKAGIDDDETKALVTNAKKAAALDKLCAWLREAVKAKEQLLSNISTTTFEEWAEQHNVNLPVHPAYYNEDAYARQLGLKIPEEPSLKKATIEDIISEMDIKQYSEYIGCNSASAVYGKLVHEGDSLNVAREELHKAIAVPYSMNEKMICHFIPTVTTKVVEDVYAQLQSLQRQENAEHNALQNKLRKEVDARNLQFRKEYEEQYAKYRTEYAALRATLIQEYDRLQEDYDSVMKLLRTQFNTWRDQETQRVSSLKIVIPDSLQEIYTELDSKFTRKA